MFSFFKKKPPADEVKPSPALGGASASPVDLPDAIADNGIDIPPRERTASDVAGNDEGMAPAPAPSSWLSKVGRWSGLVPTGSGASPAVASQTSPAPTVADVPEQVVESTLPRGDELPANKRLGALPPAATPAGPGHSITDEVVHVRIEPTRNDAPVAADEAGLPQDRKDWLSKLKTGLRKTGAGLAHVFIGAQVGDELYEELEAALLQADAGMDATDYLLDDLRKRVLRAGAKDVAAVKRQLANAIAELLGGLERPLGVGEHTPTVMMVVGVNGAGKTTTIGKLTRHLVDSRQKVMLAAADTFRAAAREQLAVWADRADLPGSSARGRVDIVSQEGADPAGVTFDAVVAGKARGCDVVIVDTAGRLTTQLHLMDELKKIRRVIGKAQEGAPHEVLLVIDGNTGQNALSQVQAFDAALQLTGLVITKLDGTAKGGVLAAIALWARSQSRPLAVYFIGVGEKLEDLQTFDAREFAQALLG
ncbi:MAG: signal recognition particle-docking protein FtsY [Caldimonas sp.]